MDVFFFICGCVIVLGIAVYAVLDPDDYRN
jgi:hypothetical protein